MIDESWIPAFVVASDPLTDIAVLSVDLEVSERLRPSDRSVAEPIDPDTTVFVGYCPTELVLGAQPDQQRTSGCGPVQTVTAAVTTETQAAFDQSRDDPAVSSALKRRSGNVWSTTQTVDQVSGHGVYDLIKTSVPKNRRMSGAALRTVTGDVVGAVVAADTPNVVALPIDRALEIGRSMLANGTASSSWLGLETRSDDSGVWITAVHDLSPATGMLAPGDRMVTLLDVPLREVDHLEHLIRTTTVGQTVKVSVTRDQSLLVVDLTVAEVPAELVDRTGHLSTQPTGPGGAPSRR